jgi:hypothetical protein
MAQYGREFVAAILERLRVSAFSDHLNRARVRYCAVSIMSHNWQALIRALPPKNALHAGSIIGEVMGCSALR